MLMRTSIAFTVLAMALGSLDAATLKVPKQFATIQAAVDAATDGDDIEIAKGTYAPFSINAKDDISIRGDGDVLIDGAGAMSSAIAITDCERVTIEKLEVFNSFTLIDLDEVVGFTVRKCKFSQSAECIAAANSRSGRIESNKFKDALNGCVLEFCIAVSIRDCEFKELGFGIGGSGYHQTFESNTFTNVATGITIVGTSITSLGTPIPALPTLIRDNVMENDSDFTGVLGSGPSNAAIRVETPNAAIVIADNQIKRPLGDGIVIDSDVQSVVVMENTIKKAGQYGILCAGLLTLIHGNTISGCQQDGVRLSTGGDACSLSHNEVEKCGGFGFVIESSANSVVRNTARDNGLGSILDAGTSSYQDNDFEP